MLATWKVVCLFICSSYPTAENFRRTRIESIVLAFIMGGKIIGLKQWQNSQCKPEVGGASIHNGRENNRVCKLEVGGGIARVAVLFTRKRCRRGHTCAFDRDPKQRLEIFPRNSRNIPMGKQSRCTSSVDDQLYSTSRTTTNVVIWRKQDRYTSTRMYRRKQR